MSLSVDLLNIKMGWGVCHVVVNRQLPPEGKKPYHLWGGGSPQNHSNWIGHQTMCIELIEVPLSWMCWNKKLVGGFFLFFFRFRD